METMISDIINSIYIQLNHLTVAMIPKMRGHTPDKMPIMIATRASGSLETPLETTIAIFGNSKFRNTKIGRPKIWM